MFRNIPLMVSEVTSDNDASFSVTSRTAINRYIFGVDLLGAG